MKQRPPWSWPGAVALVIAASLGLGWAAALIISAVHPEPTSEAGLNFLSSLGQTLAGAVAAYIGYQIGASTGTTTQDEPLRASEDDEPAPDGSREAHGA